ncbi:hypothetical protein T09_5564 [Trichinella sp. T9]|nr:hypothetical protein T09_5564 [Trichinella sp. T9]
MGSIAIKLNYGLVADRLYGDSSRSCQSLLVSVSCATSYDDSSPQTDKTPGGAFVLLCSCGGVNLPDGCWSALPHYGHSKAKF